LGVARDDVAGPLQSSKTGASCVRRVATTAASSPAVPVSFRVLPMSAVAPYGLTLPPWPCPLAGSAFEVFPRAPVGSNGWIRAGSSRGLRSAPEYDPCRTARLSARRAEQHARRRAHSPGVSSPTAFKVAGSDRRRACLTRLCCVFRLSRPPDALIPPETVPVLSHTGDAHGVRPSEVRSFRAPEHLSAFPAPPGVVVDGRTRRLSEPGPCCAAAGQRSCSEEPVRRFARVRSRCRARLQGFQPDPEVRTPLSGDWPHERSRSSPGIFSPPGCSPDPP